MNEVLKFLFYFFWIFLLILIIYTIFINRKKRSYSKLKDSDEINLFVKRYNIDIKKHSFKRLKFLIALINSFIIAFTSTLIVYIKSIIWSVLVGFIVVFILLYSIYEIVGRYYKKKEEKKNV